MIHMWPSVPAAIASPKQEDGYPGCTVETVLGIGLLRAPVAHRCRFPGRWGRPRTIRWLPNERTRAGLKPLRNLGCNASFATWTGRICIRRLRNRQPQAPGPAEAVPGVAPSTLARAAREPRDSSAEAHGPRVVRSAERHPVKGGGRVAVSRRNRRLEPPTGIPPEFDLLPLAHGCPRSHDLRVALARKPRRLGVKSLRSLSKVEVRHRFRRSSRSPFPPPHPPRGLLHRFQGPKS